MTDYVYNDPLAESHAPTMPPEDRSPATPPEALSGPLPSDLKSLLPILTKLDNTEGRTREEETARRSRLAEVRKLVFALQQGLPVTEATPMQLAQKQRELENTTAKRSERIAALRAALKR